MSMDLSRRAINNLWPLLLAGSLEVEAAATDPLPSACYPFESLPVSVNKATHAESRQVFKGVTHEGLPIDMHITTMPPGQMPHAPHHHVHEETMMIKEGKLEVTIAGKTTVVGPGSVIYVLSNEEHGLKSVGDVAAQYFVLAIGKQTKS